MVAATTCYLEGVDSTRISITREKLRTLIGHVEAELHRSEAYQFAVETFHQGAGEAEVGLYQALIKAVGREAIRLALRQLVKQHRTDKPMAGDAALESDIKSLEAASELTLTDGSANGFVDLSMIPTIPTIPTIPSAESAIAPSPEAALASPVPAHADPSAAAVPSAAAAPKTTRAIAVSSLAAKPKRHGRSTPSQKAAEAEAQRLQVLQQLGQVLREARHRHGLSIEQLHTKTWVPVHQLKALEAGEADRLPETIYIQGFVRRIATVFNLDLEDLLASLGAVDTPKNVIPSWSQSQASTAGFQLQPVHLYLGYAALMAGAVGGLAWMSNNPATNNALNPDPLRPMPEPTVQSPSQGYQVTPMPSVSQQAAGAIANPELTPPERTSLQ
ncbi:MAG TPA: helix-turn-helix domain-containing protein [Chroococcidiopsis sp.]